MPIRISLCQEQHRGVVSEGQLVARAGAAPAALSHWLCSDVYNMHEKKKSLDLWRSREYYAMQLLIMLQCFPLSCNTSEQFYSQEWKMKPQLLTILVFNILHILNDYS